MTTTLPDWRRGLADAGATVLRHHVGGLPDPWCEIVLIDSDPSWQAFELWLAERGGRGEPLGLDAETNARDPFQPGFRTRMTQIADPYTAWCVPLDGTPPGVGEALARAVRNYPTLVAHFSENDTRFLARGLPARWDRWRWIEAIRWEDDEPHVVDTQGLLALYDPRTVTTSSKKDRIHPKIPRLKGLKDTVDRELSPALRAAETELHGWFRETAPKGFRVGRKMTSWGFAHCDDRDPRYLVYGGLDALFCVRLYWLMRRDLERRGLWDASLHEQRVQWMADRATYRGMAVDPPYARWLHEELTRVVAANAPELARYGVAPSAMGPAVGAAMERLREPVRRWNRRADGSTTPSWNRAALDAIVSDGGPGAALAETIKLTRRTDKFRSVQVVPMLRTVAEADGMMHCSMRGNGTVSSRMSAQGTFTSGALHQIPKRDTRVRAAVCAERGHLLVSADLSQGEPFTMAALSGDPQYLADLLEPVAGLGEPDLNSQVALMVYGADYDPTRGKAPGTPHYEMRQACKFGHLAWCYGCRPRKLAALLGRPEHVGEEIEARWVARWPLLGRLRAELGRSGSVTLDTGHVVPLWDRWLADENGVLYPRRDAMGQVVDSRLGLNGATQGTQAQLLKWAMHRLAARGWAWALRFMLHDELLLSVPAWMAPRARDVLEECMTLSYRGVTVSAKATIEGRTWQPQVEYLSRAEIMAATDDEED